MMATVAATEIDRRLLLQLYRKMLVVRKSELLLAKSHQQGLVHGACHTYVGQEAIAAGVCANLIASDVVFSTHRGHGHALSKGVSPEQLIAELYGRETGCSHGRGGSMHLFAPEVGMMGTSGIVGPCILQAAGAGYSFKLRRQSFVAVAFFGDGAVNNGAFHEGLNMAAIWKLPVLFVCENNQYATEVAFTYSSANPHVANRGSAYGLPSIEVDGNDVLAVYQAAKIAVERARSGEGATLIECQTYRVRPHAEGMGDLTYRTREEIDEWKQLCPLKRLKSILLDEASGVGIEDEIAALEEEVTEQIGRAHERAKAAPYPPPQSAATHVYAEVPQADRNRRGCETPSVAEPHSSVPSSLTTIREITYAEAALESLRDAMELDPNVFVMGEGIGERGGNFNTTAGLYARFGAERLCDTPICERGFVGLSVGAAMTGSRPVIDFMFADFVLDAMGEIINQLAKVQYMSSGRLRMPVVLRGCIGIGHSAATHHSGNYYPMYAHFPGLRVVVPSRPYDAKGLFATALASDDPVLFLEHRELQGVRGHVPEEPYRIPFGEAAVVRTGSDVTVVALAQMVHQALAAAGILDQEGISVELIDPRTVSPLDTDTILRSVKKTGRLLIADEAFAPFGVGAEISARIVETGFDELDAPIRRLNGVHTPTPYSPTLETAIVPNVEDIVAAVRQLFAE
jgi:2-oxoisovalerate dehydrogenase E1 component